MTTEQTYLALLRATLWGTDLPVIEDIPDILLLADRQKTRGLVYHALLQAGAPLPEETAARMQQLLLKIANTHRMLDTAIARSMLALHDAGIPAVLLKGQAVARYYPNPLLRECGDVDLYIGPERLEEAIRAVSPLADRTADEINGMHWELWIGQAEIELHDHTMLPETRRQARLYRTFEEQGLHDGLVRMDFSGVPVDTPEDTFHAFYLFYHAWHHFSQGGIGFRQLCDWMLLLHDRRDHIDRERLHDILDGMGLTGPWQLFGCIVVRELGLPREEFPFYDESRPRAHRRVLRLILSEGNFGRGRHVHIQRPGNYLGGKVYALAGHVRRFFQVLPLAPREAFSMFRFLLLRGTRKIFRDLSKR